MTPGEKTGYQSKYWPTLNGAAEENAFSSAPWSQNPGLQTERESILLDVIGAYDLLLLQGLSVERASSRLGLRKSRDELVQELDAETSRRLSVQLPSSPRPSQKGANFSE